MEPASWKSDGKRKIIFFDNECPMCTAITGKISDSAQNEKFKLHSIADGPLGGISRSDAEKEIHVVDTDGKIYKGSGAILKIAEEYKGWKWLAKIGNIPVIKQLLALGYTFVAANRRFIFGPHSRIYYLKIAVAGAFIAVFLMSVKLWVSTRFYPLMPVLKIFPTIPFPFDYALFFILLLLLAIIIVSPKPRAAIAIFAALFIFLLFLDQSRWQPWAYQFLLMLIGLGLFSWKTDDPQGESNTLNALRIIVAGIYIWSGIQKMNGGFVTVAFPWMLGRAFTAFPWLWLSGFIVPFYETGIGIGLLTKKYRNVAVWMAIAMHLFIFVAIGPFGLNWNSVVWPWQLAMIIFDLLLFYKADFNFSNLFSTKGPVFLKVVAVLFLIMPIFNFFGLWDADLSAALYTGDVSVGYLYINNDVKNALPPEISQYASSTAPDLSEIDIANWSFGEVNAPPYLETRIYEDVGRYICTYASDPRDVSLVIQEKPTIFNSGETLKDYTCSDIPNPS